MEFGHKNSKEMHVAPCREGQALVLYIKEAVMKKQNKTFLQEIVVLTRTQTTHPTKYFIQSFS